MLIRVREFGGLVPKLDEKLLPDNCAVEAINVDLQGQGIEPMYAPLFKRNAGADLVQRAASIVQMPTACLRATGGGAVSQYVSFAPAGGNYTVVANDRLLYAVFLPAGATAAGQGCCDLRFTSGALLGNINDQNAIGSRDGNIAAQAQGQWYVRDIPLTSKVGSIIDEFRFFPCSSAGSPFTAFLGIAYVYNTGGPTINKILFDVDMQSAGTPVGFTGMHEAYITSIDEDEAPLVTPYLTGPFPAAVEEDRVYTIAAAALSGFARNKTILVQGYPQALVELPIRGWSNHDRFTPYDPRAPGSLTWGGSFFGSHSLHSRYGWVESGAGNVAAVGWMGIAKPTAAMSLAVVGGAAPVVTRSYVYTRVSEDGFESAPSPPVTVTGNRDGTWQLTNITSWPGTDTFSGARNPAKKRVYRTHETSGVYRFVAEIGATVTTLNDLALDAVLGEELPTLDYDDAPQLLAAATWNYGIVGGLAKGTQACFCQPYEYHAWPQANRYTIPYVGVAVGVAGDRFVVLTVGKPQWFSGSDPASLYPVELQDGEPCIGARGVAQATTGLFYPGRTGWGLIEGSGYSNITQEFLKTDDYAALVSVDTVACFDNRKLLWITQGATTGYALEQGAGTRSLTKFEVPNPIYAMSYYAPRDTRWIAYLEGGVLKMGKLFGDTATKLKWTWKSKLHRFPKPVRLKVVQVDSNEWDTLSASMKAREAAYKTGGGGAPYTISITGLTQAEAWCYLKVWCEADKGADKVLVFDDFVVSDRPVRLDRAMKSDCWQFELRGNMAITSIAMAGSEQELNAE